MAIRHYRRRRAGDDTGIAGCACRGCETWRNRAPERNAQVADPFRSFINSISGGTPEMAWEDDAPQPVAAILDAAMDLDGVEA
jgi:hypothetical protein